MYTLFNKKLILLLSLLISLGFQSNILADFTCKNVRFEIPITDTNNTTRTIIKHVPTFQLDSWNGQTTRWKACVVEGHTTTIAKPASLGSKMWMDSLGLTPTERIKFCETHPKITPSSDSGAAQDPDFRTMFGFPAFTTKVSNDSKWREMRSFVWVSQSQCTQILADHQAAIDAAAQASEEAANRCNFCLYDQKQVYKGCYAKGSKIEKNTDIPTCKLRTAKEVMEDLGSMDQNTPAGSVTTGPDTPVIAAPAKRKF